MLTRRTAFMPRCIITAVVAFGCFLALGIAVVRQGEPPLFAAWQRALVNDSTLLAWWLTWSCYLYVLLPIALLLLIVAWRFPAWRTRVLVSIVVLLVCWQGADLFQHLFARPRQLDWVVKREKSFSYPSSHATIATGFYAFWALLLYGSELRRDVRTVAAFLLLGLALAVCWSRLALGAHYLTDIVGGALLAVAIASLAVAIVPVKPFVGAGRANGTAE